MWIYRRVFAGLVACGFLFGCGLFIRLQLTDEVRQRGNKGPVAPHFLPNVPRYRTARVCSQRALILVISSPARSHRRQVIRETWAHPKVTQSLDISVAFGVGSADREDVQRLLDWEAEIYGDIFQEPSLDTGKSTMRVLRLLKTARGACAPVPHFLLKTDDDVFVNTHSVGEMLETLETYSSSNTLWCLEWNRHLDRIGTNGTWAAVASRSLSGTFRPRYCVAAAYLMTGKALDAVVRRHDVQAGRTMLPEDVYLTGVLAREAGTVLSLLGDRSAFDERTDQVEAGKVAFAYLGDRFEEGAQKLWAALVRERSNESRRSDIGL